MPRKWRIRYTGARYHVTCRGNGLGKIFYSDDDRERFLGQLDLALAEVLSGDERLSFLLGKIRGWLLNTKA